MKRIIFFIILLGVVLGNALAQTTSCSVIEDDFSHLHLKFESGKIVANTVPMNGEEFTSLVMEGTTNSQKVGNPNLPTFSTLIEVPLCGGFSVDVTNMVFDTIRLANLGVRHVVVPLQPSRSKSDTAQYDLVLNKDVYHQDAYCGDSIVVVEKVGVARDRNLARLQVSPVRYNPVEATLIICREATITVSYSNAEKDATLDMFNQYHSPAFASDFGVLNSLYPKTVAQAAPLRYLIVAHSMFIGQLDEFVAWKKRKGFITDIVYTNNPLVGTTTSSISAYIQSQYTNATATNPAPTYVLLVGDHEQIPAFASATTSSASDHISDLQYMLWTTGDYIPDCYYGRFSAQTIAQLTPQIEKTLMYEQYTFADPSFLDRAVMVAGVDGGNSGDYGYTHADPTMDYAVTNYVNGAHGFSNVFYFKNNTSIVPAVTNVTMGSNSSSNSATVRNYYNQGAGWINYSAHGSATSWGTPNFSTTHVASMTNVQKFGIMIGNCCLTNKFETATCFGESLLRKSNYCGAVGYIGGSNSTYWYEDLYWGMGLRSSINPTMSMAYNASNLGGYDRIFHTHGEAYNQWVATQGQLMMMGNMAVESSTSSLKHYYWEIYHLMGDPSVMPYLTQADSMTVVAPNTVVVGSSLMQVSAVPYAYVALTDTATHGLVVAAYADASGLATLPLPTSLPVGGYEVAVWAQQYRCCFRPVSVIAPNGPYVVAEITSSDIQVGDSIWLQGRIVNLGNTLAHDVVVRFTCGNNHFAILNDSVSVSAVSAGDTLVIDSMLHVALSPVVRDMENFSIISSTNWLGNNDGPIYLESHISAVAPTIRVVFDSVPDYLMPGETYTFSVVNSNIGHQNLSPSHFNLVSNNPFVYITPLSESDNAVLVGGDALSQYQVHIDSLMPVNIQISMQVVPSNSVCMLNDVLTLPVGLPLIETFEGMVYRLSGWAQGTNPWMITNAQSYMGMYSARSDNTLTHNQTSSFTLTYDVATADSISFYYKVFSEANYDKFHFVMDGQELITESGDVDWSRAVFPLAPGTHTFEFSYSKDYSVSSGSDCAWIDQLRVPQPISPWIIANDTLCFGQPIEVSGQVVEDFLAGDTIIVGMEQDTILFQGFHVLPQQVMDTTVNACDAFSWQGVDYSASAIITDTLVGQYDCPLIRNLHLLMHHSVADTFEYTRCDSVMGYTESGVVVDSLTTVDGCDSIVSMILTVNTSYYINQDVNLPIGPFFWDDSIYQTSGVYTHYYQSLSGCDSVVVVNLHFLNEGIGSVQTSSVQCYPNPSHGDVRLSEQVSQGVVYDMKGRKLAVFSNSDRVDLTALPRGVYFMELTTLQGIKSRLRLVLQ